MSIRALLVLLASILWFMFSTYWYCCHIQQKDCSFCPVSAAVNTTETSAVTPAAKGPITFQWSDEKAQTTPDFTDYKSGILKGSSEDNLLEIVGYYSADEENTSTFANMGLARAHRTRELFASDIPEERIRLRAELRETTADMKTQAFESVAFNWIKQEIEKTEVVQLSDRAIILFPFNSSQKEKAPAIDDYLAKLAVQLQQSGGAVSIVGHTDNVGEEARNLKLGQSRAQQIRQILLNKGVKSAQIQISSKGESDPVASNKTEEGRHQNRRVEVKVIKSEQ